MKRLLPLLLLGASASFAQVAETRVFRAIMLPSNEVPAININARGMATIRAHVIKDSSGKITSGSVDFNVDYTFPGPIVGTGLHIHNGPAGVNAGVTVDSGISARETITSDTGSGNVARQAQVLDSNTIALDTLNGMWSDPSNFYVNLHTTDNPGGVIRGQLMNAQSLVLMGMMSTANEVPAITTVEASAVGTVVALVTRDGNGTINSAEVTFDVNYVFPAQVTFTGLHVHTGAAGIAGPVTLSSGLVRVTGAENGRGNLRFRNEIDPNNAASVEALEFLWSDPSKTYINLHTTDNPGGVVRSQLRWTDATSFNVTLDPKNEVPAIDSTATGPSKVTAYTLRAPDGSVMAGHVLFDVNHRMPGEAEITGLHVHDGAAGVNGPVRLDSGLSGTNSLATASGFGNIYLRSTITTPEGLATLNSVVATPTQNYLNIHTRVNPGGLMRSQLLPNRTAAPAVGAVVSSGGFGTVGTGAPGGLVTLYGANLGRIPGNLTGWAGSSVPTSFNGVGVTIGGRSAPLVSIDTTEITVQVPVEVTAGNQPVTVTAEGMTSTPFMTPIATTAPALFIYTGGAIATKADGTIITSSNTVSAGDTVSLYCTGLGQTTPALATGVPAAAGSNMATAAATVTVGGVAATVTSSTAATGSLGVYVIVFRVPTGVTAGNANVIVRMGATQSNTSTIAVK